MPAQTLPAISLRQKEIVKDYLTQLDQHIADLKNGKAEGTFEIKDFADLLHIHPTHLSNTIAQVVGLSPCDLYEKRLVALSKELLLTTNQPIANIARQLFYDPSNFTKFFKHFEGITPKQFREENLGSKA
jgi:AraC family transcriptional regulator, regulatory protein of adaptative response / methylphosphotriester-DNA alkyltransferase methyltransferase